MADTLETKQRKSVAFDEGSVIMDTNGQVTETPAAEKPNDPEVDEVTDMFKGLSKKKTSKKSKSTEDGKTEDAPAADGEFDPSLLKKKKKKKTKTPKDFEAELAEAGVDNETAEAEEVAEGDPEAGTGIWQHDSTQAIPYALLVSRFFSVLQKQHPDMQLGKSYKMIPPNVSRQGARKSAWTNFSAICERMNRSREHVMQFTLAELGAQSGSIDKEDHLVIRGRFMQGGIEKVLRQYIVGYVQCKTCRSADTDLTKGENRLSFLTCHACGSRRSVAPIKVGFQSQIGRRKRVG